jgi:hypothetical protein
MKNGIIVHVFILVFLTGLPVGQNNQLLAQNISSDSSVRSFRLFEEDTLLEITLRFDLLKYIRTRPKDDYIKANITLNLSETDSINRDIKLKTRGIFRNKYCSTPPIELNFKKAGFGFADLDKISKIKLVVQCTSGKENEGYLLKEYIAYKLYNVFTDSSYRVRLLKINYVDTENKRKPFTQYGFFIEPIDIMAARIHCTRIKSKTMNQRSIVPEIMDRIAIFSYMIGSYDWSVPGEHNIVVVKSLDADSTDLPIAVPHDFDWTGLVDASYAIPSETIGVKDVRERIYEGICRKDVVYNEELDLFLKKKGDFYRVINGCNYINKKVKKDLIGYLDEFFNQLTGSRYNILQSFYNTCKPL